MTKILKSFYKAEHRLDAAAERFLFNHPYLGFITVFIGTPVFILAAVAVSTTVIIAPLAFLFGWL